MKFIFLLLYLLPITAIAGFKYQISIDDNGYDLAIRMEFKNKTSLQKIRNAFTIPEVLTELSPNIDKIDKKVISESRYESIMKVSSFGISTVLPSMCEETWNESTWEKKCTLETDKADGGKYMEWKTDQVICKESENIIVCNFKIKGKTKPLIVLGVELLDHRQFSVKAKQQAMHNFAKQFIYINDYSLSLKRTLQLYEQTLTYSAIEEFAQKAKDSLKNSPSYTEEKKFEN